MRVASLLGYPSKMICQRINEEFFEERKCLEYGDTGNCLKCEFYGKIIDGNENFRCFIFDKHYRDFI